MPNSYLLYTANGSNTDFSLVGIDGWISSGFLKVYVDEVLQTTGYSFINITSASPLVRFATAPANGAIVRLQRETPSTVAGFQGNIVNFNDASVLTEADLDNMAKGLLHIAQEANDTGSGALPATEDGLNWDADSKRITQVGSPTQSTDAVTKGYVDGLTLYGSGLTTPQNWTFNGTGSQTAFQLTNPSPTQTDANLFLVEVGGVLQRPTTNYTVSSSGVLTFTEAPANGTDNIVVRNWGVTRNVATFNDALTVNANFNVDGLFLVDAAANTVTTTVDPTFNGITIGKGAGSFASNLVIGNEAKVGNDGGANVAVGYRALKDNVSVASSTVVGAFAGQAATTANGMTAIGNSSLKSNTTGFYNTAVGYASLQNNTTANYNTAIGFNALSSTTSGGSNIGVGFGTLGGNVLGSDNIAIGSSAGRYIADGATEASRVDTSILIGSGSKVLASNNVNSIVIGHTAVGGGSNTTVIGNASTVSTTFPGGILSIPGGGIKFPAAQVSSADANTLDDYEEGTWTPVIRGSTTAGLFTYSTQQGIYTKIGRLVTVHVNLVVNTVTTAAAGNLEISGLPFNAGSGVNYYGPYGLYHFGIAGSKNYSTISMGSGNNFFTTDGGALGVDGTQAAISAANVGAGDYIRFTATFTV